METEQAKGRIWNGYVCPGCRNVFRVAADFAGEEVMCPSCQETLRLPRKPDDTTPLSAPVQPTTPALAARIDENQIHKDQVEPAWRTLLTSPGGRKKLSLALGVPLLVVAVVLMLLPADKTPTAHNSTTTTPAKPVSTESPEPAAPLPETDASQIADLIPEVLEKDSLPEPPPPAVSREADPALVARVLDKQPVAQMPAPVDPEHGLVDAIPATTPVAQPPAKENTSPPATRHHTVVRGDTLSRIARKYAVDPKAIMRANGMKNDVVRLGAKLVIPPADP